MKNELLGKINIKPDSKYNFIFLHGWGVNYKSMLYLSSLWDEDFSTYVLSLPGFGDNKLERSYKLDDYIKDIEDFIYEYKLENIVLIGHSFGGKLAVYLKSKHPEYHVVSIAPSIISNPKNIIVEIKIFLYKFFKKNNIPLYKLFKGSKDYQKASGFLKKTFFNVFHEYMDEKSLKELKPFLLVGFLNDEEVKISSLNKVNSYNKNIVFETYSGDHFSYFDHRYEIYYLVNKLLSEGKI